MVFTPGFERTLGVRVESDGVGDFTGSIDDAIESLGGFKTAVGLAGGALATLSAGALAEAISKASEFEDAMVEVAKVTDETTAAALSEDIRELSSTIPIAQSELAAITADAARFGIRGERNINAFTESVARMSVATDLSAQEAGEAFARLATLTRTPVSQMENFGSAINSLSNNFATSSGEIVDSMLRSSGALSQLGVQQTDIIALSASLNEVSESSERAGSRLRRLAQEIIEPDKQAKVAEALGMTAEEFGALVDEDPTGVIVRMAQAMDQGGATADRLNSVLGTESRTAISGLAQNIDGLESALGESSQAFDEATSLQEEFEAATDTVNARARVLKNRLGNLAITTGEGLLPVVSDLIGGINVAVGGFNDLNQSMDGLPAQITAVTGAAAGLGLMLSSFGIAAGGPVALAVAGVGALAIAWGQDFADIRSTTKRTADDVGGSLSRVIAALAMTERQAQGAQDVFDDFERGLAQFIDTTGTGFATMLDRMGTEAEKLILKLKGVAAALDALSRGDRQQAQQELAKGIIEAAAAEEEFQRRLNDRALAAKERVDRRSSGLPATPTPGVPSVRDQAKSDAEAYVTAFTEAYQQAQEATATDAGLPTGAAGAAGQSAGETLSAEDRVRLATEASVRARRENDATEVPGRAGELARIAANAPTGPMGLKALNQQTLIEINATIEATNREEGKRAARAFSSELRAQNIVDTNTVVGR